MNAGTTVKPNFLIIGSAKCGTSSLWHLLRQHPQVGFCRNKEPQFFNNADQVAAGLDSYYAQFSELAGKQAIGEASTTYTMFPRFERAAEAIAEHLPDAKLIYLVRDPLRRIESHWLDGIARFGVKQSFNDAVRSNVNTYIAVSQYWMQLDRYRQLFHDERLHVLFLEDMTRDPAAAAQQCYAFLGINPQFRPRHLDARNVSGTRSCDRPLLRALRSIKPLYRLARKLPIGVRKAVKRKLAPPAPRPTWDPALSRWVHEQLAEDTRQLLGYCGKPADFWPIQEPAAAPSAAIAAT